MQQLITDIIIILVGLIAVLISFSFTQKFKKIKTNGEIAEAIVFDFETRRDYIGNNTFQKVPILRFVTKKHEWITKAVDFSSSPNFLKQGDKINVIYDVDQPDNFILASNTLQLIFWLIMVAGMAAIIIGGALMVINLGLFKV